MVIHSGSGDDKPVRVDEMTVTGTKVTISAALPPETAQPACRCQRLPLITKPAGLPAYTNFGK